MLNIKYDAENDVLTFQLASKFYDEDIYPFETNDFTVEIDLDEDADDDEDVVSVTIRNARAVMAQVIAVGMPIDLPPTGRQSKKEMVWQEVDSSMIKSFGYAENAAGILDVKFQSGRVYRYYDVPTEVAEKLQQATSKGQFMNDMIIQVYSHERLV